MRIELTWTDAVMRRQLSDLGARGLAFATQNALNNTAYLVQKVEREEARKNFTLRTESTAKLINREVAKITKDAKASAKSGKPFVEIAVGQKQRLLLSAFEAGGQKEPFVGTKGKVAVPNTGSKARPTFKDPVPRAIRMSGLKFKAHRTLVGKVQLKGNKRTFILKQFGGGTIGGVFQRFGKKRGDVELLYTFVPRPKIKPTLRFVATARRVADTWLAREFNEQIALEIQRVRRRAA